jgi:hypothetical protein
MSLSSESDSESEGIDSDTNVDTDSIDGNGGNFGDSFSGPSFDELPSSMTGSASETVMDLDVAIEGESQNEI